MVPRPRPRPRNRACLHLRREFRSRVAEGRACFRSRLRWGGRRGHRHPPSREEMGEVDTSQLCHWENQLQDSHSENLQLQLILYLRSQQLRHRFRSWSLPRLLHSCHSLFHPFLRLVFQRSLVPVHRRCKLRLHLQPWLRRLLRTCLHYPRRSLNKFLHARRHHQCRTTSGETRGERLTSRLATRRCSWP